MIELKKNKETQIGYEILGYLKSALDNNRFNLQDFLTYVEGKNNQLKNEKE